MSKWRARARGVLHLAVAIALLSFCAIAVGADSGPSADAAARCRGAVATIERCRLVRKGKVVARATRVVTDQRAVMRLEGTSRLASGTYTLLVTAIGADGESTSQRIRLTLR